MLDLNNDQLGGNSAVLSENVSLTEVREKKANFFGLSLTDLENLLQGLGKEKFRAQQVYKWVYEKKTFDFLQMSNLAKDFREELPQILDLSLPKILKHLKSTDGTQKFLFDLGDGDSVESVIIPSDGRLTLCISSEVGCNMACKFCFTAKQKLKKRLKASDIVGQFLQVKYSLPEEARITNIVFMGMGEPLDNPEAVFKAIEILHSDWGTNVSRRKITVSTSGIVPEMWRIADAKVRLAVSLNGVSDEVRSKIMPINNKYPLSQLLEACREHYRKSKDKITFEYVLLAGVTDSIEDARKLYKLTKSIPCKINLIPFNEHPGADFTRPSDQAVRAFQNELIYLGAHVLVRKTMGRDIYAACGQLNATYIKNSKSLDVNGQERNLAMTKELNSNSISL
jgi:23S rRNA (adenine2503-C2)-methyltransferase